MNNLLSNVLGLLKIFIFPFCCFFLSTHAYGQSRLALVIGNQNYKVAPLRNPINDARAMSQMLKSRLGFEVVELHDLGLREMTQQLRQFIDKVENGGVALVYFAGHGAQHEEKNYLFPINFEADFAEDLSYTAMPLQTILDKLNKKNRNGANIILLDACRNNPLMSKNRSYMRGLAEVKLRQNSYIAYATLPNGVASDNPHASNGLFTQSLLKYMPAEGTNLDAMIRQVRNDVQRKSGGRQIPYGVNLLREEFCFNGCPASSAKKPESNQLSQEFAELEQLAKQGNAAAQHRLGRAYHSFYKTEFPNINPNDKLAFYWSLKAAKQNLPRAQGMISQMFRKGKGVKKDLKQSLIWLKRAATNGHSAAQVVLGGHYKHGELGLTKDYKQAFNWYQLSTRKNYAHGQFLLAGLLREGGYGIKRDLKFSSYWLEKAASNQYEGAQLLLGTNYCEGQGVPKSFKTCATWISRGFDNPNAEKLDRDFAIDIWEKYDLGKFHARASLN